MLVLNAGDTIAGQASAAAEVTCTMFGMELVGTTETYKVVDQEQLPSSAATIYTVPASTMAFIKTITIVNTDASNTNTFQLFRGGTAAANAITPVFVLPPGGFAMMQEGGNWQFYTNTGAPVSGLEMQKLYKTADSTFSATSLADIAELSSFILQANTKYRFKAMLFCSSNATTVGIHHGVNFTGTVTALRVGIQNNPVTAETAAGSAIAFGYSATNNEVIIATTAGPGTAPVLIVVEGTIEVGATGGTFSFRQASETATNTTCMRGSFAEVEPI